MHISYIHKCMHIHASTDTYIYTHIQTKLHTISHLNTYKHAHSQANKQLCTITNTFHSHAHIRADNSYVQENKYIHIPVNTYRHTNTLIYT